jgi:hypothetical protein
MLLLKTKLRTTKNQHKESPGQVGRDFFWPPQAPPREGVLRV